MVQLLEFLHSGIGDFFAESVLRSSLTSNLRKAIQAELLKSEVAAEKIISYEN